jgi:hypothetical protein
MHTMYIDTPMRGQNLTRAIARLNRVSKDKPDGLVVDDIGIANKLETALATDIQAQGRGRPTIDAATDTVLSQAESLSWAWVGAKATRAEHEGSRSRAAKLPRDCCRGRGSRGCDVS